MKKAIILLNVLFISLFCNAQQNNFAIAENYFRNNEYQKAIQLYKGLSEKSPYNNTYLQRLISCYQETEQFLAAENLLTKKLKERPNLTYLHVIKGYNFERQQKNETAEISYKKALNSIEKKASYGSLIANLFKKYNKLDYAIEAYSKIMDVNPNANYGFQLAQIYGEKGNFSKMFEAYINLVDKNENYLNNVKRYTSRYIDDDFENENNILFKKALLRKSISAPKDIWNDLLAWLFTKQKQYQKAFIQQKALLARDPNKLGNINQLGKVALDNKDYETAKKCFDLIIEKTNYPSDKFKAINNNLKIAIATKQDDVDALFKNIFNEYGTHRNIVRTQIMYADYLAFEKNKPEEAEKILNNTLSKVKSKHFTSVIKLKLGEVLIFTGKF